MELRLGGTIIYKSKQACAYVDDNVLVARNLDSLVEMFNTLEEKGRIVGLTINEGKKIYEEVSIGSQKGDLKCDLWAV
jgi:hypothetical protein